VRRSLHDFLKADDSAFHAPLECHKLALKLAVLLPLLHQQGVQRTLRLQRRVSFSPEL